MTWLKGDYGMKRIFTTTAESQQVERDDSGMFIRLLSEQPPDSAYYRKDFVVGNEKGGIFVDKGIWAYRQDIPLRYPSGDYVMYVPKRIACESKGETFLGVSYTDRTVPTKTNIKLSVVTTVKRVQELTYEELVSTRHVGLTGFIYTNPWVELNAWTKGVVG